MMRSTAWEEATPLSWESSRQGCTGAAAACRQGQVVPVAKAPSHACWQPRKKVEPKHAKRRWAVPYLKDVSVVSGLPFLGGVQLLLHLD